MVGQVLSRYRVLEEISPGGRGIVYCAVDTHLDGVVALDVLPPELLGKIHENRGERAQEFQ